MSEITEAGISKIELSKVYLDLKVGQRIIISGESASLKGVPLAELNSIKEIKIIDNRTTELTLHQSLSNEYIRNTIRVNANVAHASHGETVTEVLGDGNASKVFKNLY
ncbi:MAG: hypothetical protein IPJ43_02645 [Saprospiraceae bacterium]|nr:hypothetical protein [Saprospiraceae bacterium]